jgi:hypothetical protein
MKKKKIKIISERVRQPFKEIEEAEKESEEEEEDEIEESGEEDFTEFSSGEDISTAPVLQTSSGTTETDETLEQQLENVPSNLTGTDNDKGNIYNMPDYGQADYETSEQARERGFEIRNMGVLPQREGEFLDLKQVQQDRPNLSETERIEEEIKKYEDVRRVEEIEEERRIPFERGGRKRKERILK